MCIFERPSAHPALAYLGPSPRFTHYELADAEGVYAAAALAERPDCLELHLEVLRFGPAAVRSLRKDVAELKEMARALGKTRIVGLRQEPGRQTDPRWPKFTRLFGFTGQCVFQAAELIVEP